MTNKNNNRPKLGGSTERGKFYPKKVFQKKLSKNKSRKKFYPEVLSKMYVTYSTSLYNNN